MKKLVFLLLFLWISISTNAQIPAGIYTILSWEVSNGETIITHGIFAPEVKAQVTVDNEFITISFYGYSASLFPQKEWKQEGDFYCKTTTYKENTAVTLKAMPIGYDNESWTLSVYYNEHYYERFLFYKQKQE